MTTFIIPVVKLLHKKCPFIQVHDPDEPSNPPPLEVPPPIEEPVPEPPLEIPTRETLQSY